MATAKEVAAAVAWGCLTPTLTLTLTLTRWGGDAADQFGRGRPPHAAASACAGGHHGRCCTGAAVGRAAGAGDVLPASPHPPLSPPPRISRLAFTQAFALASAHTPSPEQVATLEQEVLRRLLTRLVRLTQQLEQAATQ